MDILRRLDNHADIKETALLDALAARSGLVCLVGAGGKKSTLYRLASLHPGRIGITATVHIPPFPDTLDARQVVAPEEELTDAVLKAAADARVVAFAQPSAKRRRLAGVPPSWVRGIAKAGGFDVILIKADGARARWLKAPDMDEPQLPEGVGTVIPVLSARVLGKPLSARIAHRVDRITALTGAYPGEIITPEHIARLLTHEQGSLKGVGNAVVVPLINMVDDSDRERLAREVAERALARCDRFDRVVLATMKHPQPLIDVVRHRT
jgi:probable selenium-dependent hydroxylase accessory protein YqeC